MFIFLDESGDLGFDFAKKATSEFFTITILICENKKSLDDITNYTRRTIKRKLNHNKSSRRVKELKGMATTLAIKKYWYGKIENTKLDIYSVTIKKKKVYSHLQTKQGKKKLYNFLARFLIDQIPLSNIKASKVNLIMDKCKNKEEIKDFNEYMSNHLSASLPMKTMLYITHESSEQNLCLQAVDMFCWGIYRKYKKDKSWYNIFAEKIKYDEMYLSQKKTEPLSSNIQ